MLAEEIVFLGRRQRGVAVGGADHAELVGIGAEPRLQHQAVLQRGARIFVGQHFRGLRPGEIQIGPVPGLVVGEFVLGRQEGMRLAVPLDLGHLVDRLPFVP